LAHLQSAEMSPGDAGQAFTGGGLVAKSRRGRLSCARRRLLKQAEDGFFLPETWSGVEQLFNNAF